MAELSQEIQSEINALRQRAHNYAEQLAKSFNVMHPGLQLSFEVAALVKAGDKRIAYTDTTGIMIVSAEKKGKGA
jgi:hypothetical protein